MRKYLYKFDQELEKWNRKLSRGSRPQRGKKHLKRVLWRGVDKAVREIRS